VAAKVAGARMRVDYFRNLPYDVLSGIGMNGAFFYLRSAYEF
jgi:hypothetical protein